MKSTMKVTRMIEGLVIRRAEASDASNLAALEAETFVSKFGHLYDPADLKAYLESTYSPEIQLAEISDSTNFILLAEHKATQKLVGYGHAGRCKLPVEATGQSQGEVKRLYLLDEFQGQKIGQALLDQMLEYLSANFEEIYLGVWSENYGAQRFYARYGFTKVGEYDYPVGDHVDREFILKRG